MRTRSSNPLVAVLVAAVLSMAEGACGGATPAAPTAGTGPPSGGRAVVVHLDDGDTIDVDIAGGTERVRFIGIDTPETKKPDTPVQCYGPEASAFTAQLVPVGTEVQLVRDAEARDPYHRLLAYVYRASDGLFVNLELARQGYADVLRIAPNTSHAADFDAAVRAARDERRGLWGACPRFGSPASATTVAPGGG